LHLMVEYAIDLPLTHLVLREPAVEMNQMIVLIRGGLIIGSFTDFLTYSVIVGIYYAFNYYQKYREREVRALQLEGRLAQAELQNLKMQLHPHFLFNTLHAISVLMQEDVQAANRMLVRLGDLLRMTLDNVGTHEVSLKQELEFLQGYLEIEQTRFQDRLTICMDVDPLVLDARVPNLILQPLVENAIRHGIAPRASSGKLEIRAAREDGSIRLEVQDNGLGLPEADEANVLKGVGLSNTRARLEQLYGPKHQFKMSNAEGGGLLVSILIPFRID
ncbi:MAG TPA: histidine kinase, partial [Blastocatellia bacterium]|nr:histidine kinase [Blastocatellia bacterium]